VGEVELSRLEAEVAHHLLSAYPELLVVPQARAIIRTKKTRFEIDLYLPELLLGFEVQDFASHSREESSAKNPWKKRMKGPSYHARKAELALAQLGVTIVELWQDEVEDGSFRELVDAAVLERLAAK